MENATIAAPINPVNGTEDSGQTTDVVKTSLWVIRLAVLIICMVVACRKTSKSSPSSTSTKVSAKSPTSSLATCPSLARLQAVATSRCTYSCRSWLKEHKSIIDAALRGRAKPPPPGRAQSREERPRAEEAEQKPGDGGGTGADAGADTGTGTRSLQN